MNEGMRQRSKEPGENAHFKTEEVERGEKQRCDNGVKTKDNVPRVTRSSVCEQGKRKNVRKENKGKV